MEQWIMKETMIVSIVEFVCVYKQKRLLLNGLAYVGRLDSVLTIQKAI